MSGFVAERPQPATDAQPPRVLVIAPNGSYRTVPFLDAARRLRAEVVVASQGTHALTDSATRGLNINFSDRRAAVTLVIDEARRRPFGAVIGTDDSSSELAAEVAQVLGLPFNDPGAVRLARRKDLARARLFGAGSRVPAHRRIDLAQDLDAQARAVNYPCVLKPLAMSASRGVIRVNNRDEFVRACRRIATITADADGDDERRYLLAEDFIPGDEIAVECLLTAGVLNILTIFDKPDPLNGPYFEETYYITPTRLSQFVQEQVRATLQSACAAYGLREGPVHAECRINKEGVWILEVAARTIGGLCGRLLRFGTGYGLEELVLRHALRRSLDTQLVDSGAGVLMIPVAEHGILRRVEGLLDAQKVEFIEEIMLQKREGHELVPWPEGDSYLGFMFARAPTPAQAEAALRRAHACLRIVTSPLWRGTVVSAVNSQPCSA